VSWNYQLSLECGGDEKSADECLEGMQEYLPLHLDSFVSKHIDTDGNYWVSFSVPDSCLSELDWNSIQDRIVANLPAKLPFRFAVGGHEVEQARTYSELTERFEPDIFDLLVVSAEIWNIWKRPSGFVPFGNAQEAKFRYDSRAHRSGPAA
jgi:hypothetical protein